MSVSRVFVDTGAWFALQVTDDRHHEAAASALPILLSTARMLLTSNLVVGETYTLLRITKGYGTAKEFLHRTATSDKLEVAFIDRAIEERAYRLLNRFAEHPFSYVDATSFAIMKGRRVRHAFAFDRHFSTAGFVRVPIDLPPEQL